jgi:hypothetical protein
VLNKEVSGFRHLEEYRPEGEKRYLLGIRLRKAGDLELVFDNPPIISLALVAKGFKRRI